MQSYELSNSMQTQWTKPTSEQEIAYFSKNGRLLNKYRSAIKWHSVLWLLFAFFGIQLGIAHLTEAMELPTWLPSVLAFLLVYFIHGILLESTEKFCFDYLDNDPDTNSSIWIPAILIVTVFLADRWGMQYLGEQYGYKAKVESTTAADSLYAALSAQDLAAYNTEKSDLEALYKEKERAAALPYTAIINDLKRRETIEKKRFTSKISEQRRLKDEAVARVAAERSTALAAARSFYEESTEMNKDIHTMNLGNVQLSNGNETAKQSASEQITLWGSWVIAIAFVLTFLALNWRMADMGVKCGVRPRHSFTPLDKYGGVGGWFLVTAQDIWRRQMVRLAAIIHRHGTKGTQSLHDLDTTVQFGQVDYNTPKPTLPDGSDDETKVKRLYPRQSTPAQIGSELQHTPVTVTNETLVITTKYTDAKAELARLLQRIQIYHSKWKSDVGATATIINNLIEDWAAATRIVTSTPAEVLGEQVERFHRVADLEYEMLKTPRAKDVKKEAAA